jgi:hypothetical protein
VPFLEHSQIAALSEEEAHERNGQSAYDQRDNRAAPIAVFGSPWAFASIMGSMITSFGLSQPDPSFREDVHASADHWQDGPGSGASAV